MTAEELGAACRSAGLTAAKDPALSVRSALSWWQDGRAVHIDEQFHRVTSLLDRRWLTFRQPVDRADVNPG